MTRWHLAPAKFDSVEVRSRRPALVVVTAGGEIELDGRSRWLDSIADKVRTGKERKLAGWPF